MKWIVILVLTLLTCSTLIPNADSADISFLGKDHAGVDSIDLKHVFNIIRQALGELILDDFMSSAKYLMQFATGSFLKPKEQTVMYLVDSLPDEHPSVPLTNSDSNSLTDLASKADIVSDTNSIKPEAPLVIVDLVGKDADTVKKALADAEGKFAGRDVSRIAIKGTQEEHMSILNSVRNGKRLLQQVQPDSSYIIKFGFSVMFIIVTASVLIAIANMEIQRDTLLYAKFIADVGNN